VRRNWQRKFFLLYVISIAQDWGEKLPLFLAAIKTGFSIP
jgi:hypothetical protein